MSRINDNRTIDVEVPTDAPSRQGTFVLSMMCAFPAPLLIAMATSRLLGTPDGKLSSTALVLAMSVLMLVMGIALLGATPTAWKSVRMGQLVAIGCHIFSAGLAVAVLRSAASGTRHTGSMMMGSIVLAMAVGLSIFAMRGYTTARRVQVRATVREDMEQNYRAAA